MDDLKKLITSRMAEAYLIEESGYPGDAEERAAMPEMIEEYRQMIIRKIQIYCDKQSRGARIEECREIANTIVSNKQGIHPDLPLNVNQIEEWIGRRLRNYIQNGAQDELLAELESAPKEEK